MERVIHTCNCLSRSFTSSQWGDFRKEEPKDGIVFRYGEFGFNVNDICLTPHKAIDWQNKVCRYLITTAQSPCGFWEFGLSCSVHNSGYGHGARFCKDETHGYPTEREAIHAALLECKRRTERELESSQAPDWDDDECPGIMKNSSAAPYIKDGLKQLELYLELFDPAQLTLF